MNTPETINIEKYAHALNELIGVDSAYLAGDKDVDTIVEVIVAAKKLENRVRELTEENERLRDLITELQQYNESWVEDNGKLRKEIEKLKQQYDFALHQQFQAYTNNLKYFEDIYDKELDKLKAEKADMTYFKKELIADAVRKMQKLFEERLDISADGYYSTEEVKSNCFETLERIAEEILEENNG